MVRSSQERQPSRPGRPPRRRTDRVGDAAAWLLTAAGLFLLLFGVFVGVSAHRTMTERARAAERELVRMDAVLVADPSMNVGGPEYQPMREARYVDAAGREHDVVVPVAGQVPAGSSVTVWVDRDGRPAAAPPTTVDAVVLGIAAGVGVVGLAGAGLAGLWSCVRWWQLARDTAAWAREWAVVEPEWSGRGR